MERVTAKNVIDQLCWLEGELFEAGLFIEGDYFDFQESSTTYGRAWRVFINSTVELPTALVSQLGGGSSFVGDTSREAMASIQAARRIVRAIVETRKANQRETLGQLASLGVPVASLACGFMDSGLTFSESIAASTALAVSR